jgi:hypothetical protein
MVNPSRCADLRDPEWHSGKARHGLENRLEKVVK